MKRQIIRKSALCLLMALVCQVTWAQTSSLFRMGASATSLSDGNYVLVAMSNKGTGPVIYDPNAGEGKCYRCEVGTTLKAGDEVSSKYVWKIDVTTVDGVQHITVKYYNDTIKAFPVDGARNQNFTGSGVASLKTEVKTVSGVDYIALTLDDASIGYIHANAPGGNPCLSYWPGYGDDGTCVKFTFYPVSALTEESTPVVVTSILEDKLYTLECRSGAAHNTARFIGITAGGKISGQSAEAAFIQFEKANEENGYYIKIVDADKYLNHNGTNISAGALKSTVWTLGVGGKDNVANVVTFTIGDDKYLNNNGSDCDDNTCTNLKANPHDGGPGSGNACSLWKMTQYPEPEPEAPRVVTSINKSKYYTLECRSSAVHNTARFIGVAADGKINGQSAEATFIKFEDAGVVNGYYIKVLDADKYLNHDGTNISASAEKSTVWTLGVGGKDNVARVVTFTIGSDKYLNNNGSDCDDNTCTNLKANPHGGGPGSGNACSLWKMTEYSEKQYQLHLWKESVLPYIGYVGGYSADLRDEIEAVATTADKETFEAEHEELAIDADTYYRLVCVHPKPGNGGDSSYNTLTFDGKSNLVTRPTDDKELNQLFRFEDAGDGKYYLRNVNAEAYLNKIAAGNYRSAVVAKEEACKVEISLYEGSVIQWKLHNSESISGNNHDKHCLFAENHPGEIVPYACAGWEAGANSASAWYIVPVTDFAYVLTVSAAKYATLYLNFAVEIPEDVKVYIAESVEDDRLKMAQVTGVLPAETGVIVRAEEGTYGFVMSDDEPSTDVKGNLLKGTTTNKYITADLSHEYYVLSKQNGVVAMYKPSLTDDRFLNNANKAYLSLDTGKLSLNDDEVDTGIQLSNRLRFDFGGTTSIDDSQLIMDDSQLTIYDLTGRRVEKMEKGIYIVNGKKVVVE